MISHSHLFECWDIFKKGKRQKKDVQRFEQALENNIFQLHDELKANLYQHGSYEYFRVFDPKERSIHAANVRDRLVHQMLYSTLNRIIDDMFIFHSLSCRLHKGTHFGIEQLNKMILKVTSNYSQPCYSLKMDIKRFFDSIDHSILKSLITKYVRNKQLLNLIDIIIDSFFKKKTSNTSVGIPLGNLTSQLFGNIYLHELDLFIKHHLRFRFYLRYCDDFILLSNNKDHLKTLVPIIQEFLNIHLQLTLHPNKIILRKLSEGIDFIGYVLFEKHRLLRLQTNRRMQKRLKMAHHSYLKGNISTQTMDQKLQSYLGLISHVNQHDLSQTLKNKYWTRG